MTVLCRTGKQMFATCKAARTALNACTRSGRQRRHERSFYRCADCRAYHLTSNPPKKGARFT